jgi:hypothetical protein
MTVVLLVAASAVVAATAALPEEHIESIDTCIIGAG